MLIWTAYKGLALTLEAKEIIDKTVCLQEICKGCKGSGAVYATSCDDSFEAVKVICPDCNGSGVIRVEHKHTALCYQETCE